MLTIRNLTLALPNGRVLFDNLDAQAQQSERICITGPNGAGKSTLLKAIAGFFAHQSGNIRINKTNIEQLRPQHRSAHVGFMVQHPHHGCIPSLTVQENMVLAAHKKTRAGLTTPCHKELLATLTPQAIKLGIDLAQLWHQPMQTLSGGQQQLIVFLMTTLHCPPVLLLDEPTAALSPVASMRLGTALQQLSCEKKVTLLCITHDQQFAEQIQTHEWRINSQPSAPASFDFSGKTGHYFQSCSS